MALSRAEESVYVTTFFGRFKGKRNCDQEAPKLRNHFREEIFHQRVLCERKINRKTECYLTFCLY